MVDVEQWAALRGAHFVGKESIKQLVRETGLSRNTIRQALRSDAPPKCKRAPTESVLENELNFQDQLDRWFGKVNARTHKTLRVRPIDGSPRSTS